MAFQQALALVAVTEGPEHRFVLANPGFLKIIGRGDLTGRTVREVLPELEAQGVFARFDRVDATGEPFVANEQRILLHRDRKKPYEGWFNVVYQPLVDGEGQVTGILQQILVNLLSNAVEFTDAGGRISLGCEVQEEHIRLFVRDTGIGIPADRLESIFEPFVQVRADLARTAEGTGLGLAISRDLARGMSGDLTVESTPGVGSAFALTLIRST